MGFFGNLWNGIKNVAGKVWGGVKDVAGKVYTGIGKGINWVREKVQPIVEGVANFAGKIPIIGAPLAGAAGAVNSAINQVGSIYDTVGRVGSKIGQGVEAVGRAIGGGSVPDTHKAVQDLVQEGSKGYNEIRQRVPNRYQRMMIDK